MGKFSKGQFVRVLHTDYAEEFPLGSTFKVGDVYGHGVEPEGEHSDLFFLNYEIEAWQPRVGERVRYRNATYGEAIVKDVLPDGKFLVDTEGRYGICTERLPSLEPTLSSTTSEQSATLKIEAGKFYKTRDGRKVGPSYRYFDGWSMRSEGGNMWYSDGARYFGGNEESDIISEWVDEPAAKPSNDNAKPKFKVGDKVKHPTGEWSRYYKVTKIENGKFWIEVLGTPLGFSYDVDACDWLVDRAEPKTPTTNTSIVALIENGKPKPSSTPFVHSSTGAAETEAKRLAGKHKGKKFGVFTLTTTHEQAATVYGQKWQNLAALGLKIDAIKELREFASLDLVSAKQAVETFVEKAA